MFYQRYGAILGLLAFVLIAASGLWGLLTYGLPAVRFPLLGEVSGPVTRWGVVLMLVIGLGMGWVVSRYVMRRQEPRGRVWSVLIAGAFGAWLGGMILGKWRAIWSRSQPHWLPHHRLRIGLGDRAELRPLRGKSKGEPMS